MKIRIIDLLNKIANGEEVPKKIKYDMHIYEYVQNSLVLDDFNYYSISNGFLYNEIDFENHLNDKVEIIEDKKIDRFEMCTGGIMGFDGVENITSGLKDKINELIDVINNLKGSDE